MTRTQAQHLQQMIRKEILAAIFEGELLFASGGRHHITRREMETRVAALRREADYHAEQAADK